MIFFSSANSISKLKFACDRLFYINALNGEKNLKNPRWNAKNFNVNGTLVHSLRVVENIFNNCENFVKISEQWHINKCGIVEEVVIDIEAKK